MHDDPFLSVSPAHLKVAVTLVGNQLPRLLAQAADQGIEPAARVIAILWNVFHRDVTLWV
jgi:hypothetical protein